MAPVLLSEVTDMPMSLLRRSALAGLMLFSAATWADGAAPYRACFESAAAKHGVPTDVLIAIAEQESSFNPKAINRANTNKSVDYGIMQINSWWLPKLKRFGITSHRDLFDACTNIEIGAWIFAQGIQTHGWNWRGIGAYNARTDSKRLAYAEKILRRWVRRAREDEPVRYARAG